MSNLFIDTNVLLNFFSFSNDHLSRLQELIVLVKKKDIILFVPEQVVDELKRNRESKLKQTIQHLEKDNLVPKPKVPVVCRDFKEMKEIQNRIDEARKLSDTLSKELNDQISSHSLQADKLISEIFGLGQRIQITEEILSAARTRYDRGNPPGKAGSYGDAINWECLLARCPNNENLYFVGGDKDYKSAMNPSEFSPFLYEEWNDKKHSKILYFETISEFIKQKFAQIRITDEQIKEEKEVAAQSLSASLSGRLGSTVVTNFEKTIKCSNCEQEFTFRESIPGVLMGFGKYAYPAPCPYCKFVNRVSL